MPSATFANLPAQKQERLLEAATREFSRRPFSEASINQIIKDAGIPRGSFYTVSYTHLSLVLTRIYP